MKGWVNMQTYNLNQVEMGSRIRKHRELLGITREQLAEKLEVSPKFVGDLEYGLKGMSLKRFCRLIQILGVPADYLLLGDVVQRHLICEMKFYVE